MYLHSPAASRVIKTSLLPSMPWRKIAVQAVTASRIVARGDMNDPNRLVMTVENNPILPLTVDAPESSGGTAELRPDQGTAGSGGSDQRKRQSVIVSWSRLPRSRLPAAERTGLGFPALRPNSSFFRRPPLKCAPRQIPCAEPENYTCFHLMR